MSVRSALAAALLVSLALLSACAEDDPVPELPDPTTPTSEPSPTDSSSTAGPETPEEFIRRAIEVELAMENTGDATAYRTLIGRCAACKDLADRVERIYSNGGFVKNDGWRLRRVEELETATGGDVSVDVIGTSTTTRYKESADAPVKRYVGGPIHFRYDLVRNGDSWFLFAISEYAS